MRSIDHLVPKITTISVSMETHKKLINYGSKNQSFDKIVSELLEFRKNHYE